MTAYPGWAGEGGRRVGGRSVMTSGHLKGPQGKESSVVVPFCWIVYVTFSHR